MQTASSDRMGPRQRLAYSPIAERPRLVLPQDARLVVWTIVNVEEWDIDQPMPRTVLTPPAGGSPSPDIPNWSWHEYGNRVGFWRMLEVFDQFRIPGVLAVNGSCLGSYPQMAQAALERHWEFLGHGYIQKSMQKVDDEAEAIRLTTEAIRNFTGKAPRGWLGPGLTETWHTPDLLQEAGYDYVCDWVLDDQPVLLQTRSGAAIANIPYTQECNDVAMMLIQHHSAREYYERAMDQFEQLHADAFDSARVMALVVHPYIMGVPHRLKWFRKIYERLRARKDVLFWTGEQIVDWHRSELVRLQTSAAGPKAG